jgi:L-threonylcarbamoyladenylate synthase
MTDDIQEACRILRQGGVILYPTDTVWGLGCDATSTKAVQRIFQIKQRADGKALITLLDDAAKLYRYVDDVPDIAIDLIDVSTTPLTIIYERGLTPPLAPELLAADGSIGIRVTHEEFSRQLCRAFGRPVVSTSANISGQPTPSTFREIAPEIVQAVDYTVHYRQNDYEPHAASSIIKLNNDGSIKIIRK